MQKQISLVKDMLFIDNNILNNLLKIGILKVTKKSKTICMIDNHQIMKFWVKYANNGKIQNLLVLQLNKSIISFMSDKNK